MNIENFTAEQILNIPSVYPEKLYSVDTEEELKKSYRKLAMIWHPDRLSGTSVITNGDEVFSHLKFLYETALKKMALGEWNNGNKLNFTAKDGTKYIMTYHKEDCFELGKQYISDSYSAWVFDKGNEDLIEVGIKEMTSFKFMNDKMKEEMVKYLPTIKKIFETEEKTVIVVEKSKSLLRVKDILSYYNGKLDPKHVAWIMSCLYNLACYLEVTKKMHGAINIENFFINPSNHTGALLGGWWFNHHQNANLIALSQNAASIAPLKIMNNKKADTSLNLEMIRQIGRQLLGDITGVHLPKDKNIPPALLDWVRGSHHSNAFEEYRLWQEQILKDSFGVRRFTEMKVTSNDVYI